MTATEALQFLNGALYADMEHTSSQISDWRVRRFPKRRPLTSGGATPGGTRGDSWTEPPPAAA